MSAAALVQEVLGADPEPALASDLLTFWQATREQRRAPLPADAAVRSGFASDRLGFAFAGGYQAALRALVPELDADAMTCLSATEDGGAHPRAIRTLLVRSGSGFHLSGSKRWSTLASLARNALVVASIGEEAGQNRLRVVRVALDSPGVRLEAMPEPSFVPGDPPRRAASRPRGQR